MTHVERVGIREMRQNLSRDAQRARDGESFALTDRGEEIARLVPAPGRMSLVDRLVAERGARRGVGSIHEVEPVDVPGPPSDEILEEQRAERVP